MTEWGHSVSLLRSDTSSPPPSESPADFASGTTCTHCSPENTHIHTYEKWHMVQMCCCWTVWVLRSRCVWTSAVFLCLCNYQRVSVGSSSELFLQSFCLVSHLQLVHSAAPLRHRKPLDLRSSNVIFECFLEFLHTETFLQRFKLFYFSSLSIEPNIFMNLENEENTNNCQNH